ncbi:RHS repeat domain-containing protein [Nonomuraea sp. JJY05]|uniref:RHS repeat domain-containing protein n=1 Tax=Nonomuraea sp. JJY05 TaxID=3350255 RepID=UPI00373F86F2
MITPVVRYSYDAAGHRKSTTDPRGYVTSYEYDQLGRQVRVTDPAPDGQAAGMWVSEYDLAGETLATVDPTGARSQATYDDLGRQITVTQIERKPASAAYTTAMEYDDAGRLVKQTAPGSRVTSYTLNAAGEALTVTDPLTNKAAMDYDLAGRLVKTTDANGNATVAEYDLAGRKTVVKDLNSSGAVLRTYNMGYDLAGNQISSTSPEGHITRQTFDALSRLTSLIEPVSASESITTSFGYDAAGARTRFTDGRGNASWTGYNSLGLVETVTEPSTTAHPDAADRTWTHVYDEAGNPKATIQPGGVRIDRTFDRLGRLTKESGAGGGAATAERTFGYDLAGRSTTAGDLTVDFNDRGLPLKVSRGTAQETAFAYDALGNPTQRIDAAGTAIFTYDAANRLKTATDPVTSRTLTYGYDPASRLKTVTATGTASTLSFDYDDMNRLTGQTLKNGSGTQLAKVAYGWDKDDNLTSKTTVGTAGAGTSTYGYDHAGRLTSWTAPGGAVTSYEWDAAGNRTKAGGKTFTYDERNRLTSGDGTDYTYTARGTLATSTKAGATTQYTFDAFDRLIADGDSLYSYDALDRMTSRIRGTAKNTFAYSGLGNDLAAITDSGGAVQAKYARDPGGGLLGLKEGTGTAAAALSDLHGDLIATFTTSLQSSAAYDPFGTVTAQTGVKTNLGYQGEYTDVDTGKVNMHARWYQPGTGTFTSRDTATLTPNPSVQANRYTYANASPLTGTDPTGHATVIDNGSIAGPGNSYSSGVDYQTASNIYAQHGIVVGGGGSSSGSGGCIGYSLGACGGGGAVEKCIACISSGQIITSGFVIVMTIEQMKTQNVLPNGMEVPKGLWDAPKGVRAGVIKMAYDGIPAGIIQELWKEYRKAHPAGSDLVLPGAGDPDHLPDYVLWWNGHRITFSSKGEAYGHIMDQYGKGKICLMADCMGVSPWSWLDKTESHLQKTWCSQPNAKCVKDTRRAGQELVAKVFMVNIGVPATLILKWSGEEGIGGSKGSTHGGVYLIIKDYKLVKVGETHDFNKRKTDKDYVNCRECQMLVLFRVQDVSIRKGIEDIIFDAGYNYEGWRIGDAWNKQRYAKDNKDLRPNRTVGFDWLDGMGIGLAPEAGDILTLRWRKGGNGLLGRGSSWKELAKPPR